MCHLQNLTFRIEYYLLVKKHGSSKERSNEMKNWVNKRKKSISEKVEAKRNAKEALEEIENAEELEDINELEDNGEQVEFDKEEFNSFFKEALNRFPKKTSAIILSTYDKSKAQAEKIIERSKVQFDEVFEMFLEGVDEETKRKTHATVHAASLTAAIIGCSPIPFSDAFLLVPIQLTMMGRLHKIFGQKFSESIGESLTRELVITSLGKSAVGNLMKLIPAVGTVAGAAVNAVVASTITQALGWVTVKMLNNGEDIFDNVMSFKGQFNMLFNALKDSDKS